MTRDISSVIFKIVDSRWSGPLHNLDKYVLLIVLSGFLASYGWLVMSWPWSHRSTGCINLELENYHFTGKSLHESSCPKTCPLQSRICKNFSPKLFSGCHKCYYRGSKSIVIGSFTINQTQKMLAFLRK